MAKKVKKAVKKVTKSHISKLWALLLIPLVAIGVVIDFILMRKKGSKAKG